MPDTIPNAASVAILKEQLREALSLDLDQTLGYA